MSHLTGPKEDISFTPLVQSTQAIPKISDEVKLPEKPGALDLHQSTSGHVRTSCLKVMIPRFAGSYNMPEGDDISFAPTVQSTQAIPRIPDWMNFPPTSTSLDLPKSSIAYVEPSNSKV
ncbi:unnamed protein product [Protopolystoma xenopodis]|uniref:Uncharacterized protein n=1 Tax=Protopolystoma xenopodis TaxID=117903 RepID=A0A3S5A0Z8_9PLAT|nr:unnamed protein product [Protopolystoma xenopodis]